MEAIRRVKQFWIHHKQTLLMLLGISIGAIAGSIASSLRTFTSREVMYIGFLGDIFMRVLRLIALPLLVSCLASALANLHEGMSLKMIIQYLGITLFLNIEGAILSTALTLLIRPGHSDYERPDSLDLKPITLQDMFLDLGRNLVPPNPIGMFAESYETALRNDSRGQWHFVLGGNVIESVNMIGVVVASIVFGLVAKKFGNQVTSLKDLIETIASVTFLWMNWIMCVSPILLASLVGAQIMKVGLAVLISRTGKYMATFLTYHFIQLLIMYPLAFFVLTRENPLRFYSGKVILTALGTSSSLATLPIAIAFLEQDCRLDPSMVRVFLSVGVNISKIGNLLGLSGMSIFMAQASGMTTDVSLIVKILLLAAPISIAIPGVPFSMIAALITVLGGCGIPAEDVGLVISVEWLNDRFVTTVNIMGNLLTVAMMAHFYKELFSTRRSQENSESVSESIL